MDPARHFATEALLAILALILLRALAAAVEAALVALGQPRALELGAPGAGRRARCVAALARDPEGTGATIRAVETSSVVLVGLLAAVLGTELLPDRSAWLAGLLVALGAAAGSLLLSAVGRGVGAAHPEAVALGLAVPVRALRLLLRPLGRLVALFGAGRARFNLPMPPLEEMERRLAEYARAEGRGAATSELIHNVFELTSKVARDVMVPRTELLAVDISTPVPEILRLLAEQGHSRVPVYQGQLDQVVGVLHVRDLVPLLAHPELIILRDVLRPAHFVPWSKPLERLLRELQHKKLHMALVVDEFGGVMGLCTLEDVLEQIVGEIHDEFHVEVQRPVVAQPDGSFSVEGSALIGDFNEATGADLPEGDGVETVGGFLNGIAGAIPARGDRFFWRGWTFTVSEADPRRVLRVRATPAARPQAARAP